MYTGKNIRFFRKEKNLTQKALGKLCGMSESHIGQYELDFKKPKIETLQKIASALDIPVIYLLSDDLNINFIKNILGVEALEELNNISKLIGISLPKLIALSQIQGLEILRAHAMGENPKIIIKEFSDFLERENIPLNEHINTSSTIPESSVLA